MSDLYHLNTDGDVAVSNHVRFLRMDHPEHPCPVGVKVLLLNVGGVATQGVYDGRSKWAGWHPIPGGVKNDE